MKVICFSAFKGSGKDMLADYMVNNHEAIRIAFADPLKDAVSEQFGIPRHHLDDPKFKESPLLNYPVDPKDKFCENLAEFMVGEFRTLEGKKIYGFHKRSTEWLGLTKGDNDDLIGTTAYHTPRSLAILWGSTNRFVKPSIWVDIALNDIKSISLTKPNSIFVISDLRYKSEIEQIEKEFGVNAVCIRIDRFDNSQSTDPSEMDLVNFPFKYRIKNRGLKEEAFDQLEKILCGAK